MEIYTISAGEWKDVVIQNLFYMKYIEFKLLNGNVFSVREDLILSVLKLEYVSKEMVKERPFLKTCVPCTVITISGNPLELYCSDPYESVMQRLSQ